MEKLRKIEDRVTKLSVAVAYITLAVYCFIMLLTVADVLSRRLFNAPILGSYEIIENSMILAVFPSYAYCQMKHGHVHINMLINVFPRSVKFTILSVLGLASAAMCFMMVYAAQMQARVAFSSHYTSSVLLMPLWPFYWIEVLGMFVLGIAFLFYVAENAVAIFNKEQAEYLQQYLN